MGWSSLVTNYPSSSFSTSTVLVELRGFMLLWMARESSTEAVILQAVYREPPRLSEHCHTMGDNPLFMGSSPNVLDKTIALSSKQVEDSTGVEVWPPPTDPGLFPNQYRADM